MCGASSRYRKVGLPKQSGEWLCGETLKTGKLILRRFVEVECGCNEEDSDGNVSSSPNRYYDQGEEECKGSAGESSPCLVSWRNSRNGGDIDRVEVPWGP